jgi:predicted RND superfamily exporter protein
MAGMLCLQGHILIPAGQLGVLAACGIAFALTASLFFIPAVVSLLPTVRPIRSLGLDTKDKPALEKVLDGFGRNVTVHPKKVILTALLLTVLMGIGCFFVTVNTDPVNYYDKDHPISKSAGLINKHLGGFFTLSVVIKGDIKKPAIHNKIDRLEKQLAQFPEVGNTQSIARVVRQMSRVLNDRDEAGYDGIPETRNAVAQYFALYGMSGDPEDF